VNIEQGFQNAGIEVTTTAWLDRQEQNTSAAKAAYVQWMKEEAARKQTSELAVMFDHPYKEPDQTGLLLPRNFWQSHILRYLSLTHQCH